MKNKALRVGIIGLGCMGKTVIDTLAELSDDSRPCKVVGALVRNTLNEGSAHDVVPICHSVASLLAEKPDVVVECASHSAVETYAEEILNSGVMLILASVGALADDALYRKLKAAADSGDTSLFLPAGAVGGLDALSAAKMSGLKRVRYTGRKPLAAWAGTPAETICDVLSLKKPHSLFVGTAREVALLYPKNSNVAAAVALAGIGMDTTEVELVADPDIDENFHEIEVFANSGSFKISLTSKSLPANARTSALAAYSMAKSVISLNNAIVI